MARTTKWRIKSPVKSVRTDLNSMLCGTTVLEITIYSIMCFMAWELLKTAFGCEEELEKGRESPKYKQSKISSLMLITEITGLINNIA